MAWTKHCKHGDWNRCDCDWWFEKMYLGRRARTLAKKFAGRIVTSKADLQLWHGKFQAAVIDGSYWGSQIKTGGLVADLTTEQITALYFERVLGITAQAATTILRTFGQLIDAYIVRHGITTETARTRFFQFEYAKEYFGADRPLTDFTTLVIEEYGDYLRTARLSKQGRAIICDDEGAARHIFSLSAVWTWGCDRNLVPCNPFLGRFGQRIIKIGERNPPREVILAWPDEQNVLDLCCRHEQSTRRLLHDCVIGSVDSGLRQNELEDLRITDLDILPDELRVRPETNKRRKGRSVPILTRRLQAIIDKRRLTILGERKAPDAFVFDADGLGLRKADVGDTWRVVRRQLNIDHVRWHDLRGTFLSRLLAIGVPNARVAQLAGHASLRMMDVYNRQPGITAEHIAEFKILFASLLPREASAPRRRAAA